MAKYAIISLDEKSSNPLCWIITPQSGLSISAERQEHEIPCLSSNVPVSITLDQVTLDNYVIVKTEAEAIQKARKLINKEIGNEN